MPLAAWTASLHDSGPYREWPQRDPSWRSSTLVTSACNPSTSPWGETWYRERWRTCCQLRGTWVPSL
eukprot:7739411-Prorocentrum_lima.AAC.1